MKNVEWNSLIRCFVSEKTKFGIVSRARQTSSFSMKRVQTLYLWKRGLHWKNSIVHFLLVSACITTCCRLFIHTWSIISQIEIYLTNFQIRFSQQSSVIYKNVIPRFRHIYSRRITLHQTVLRLLLPNRVQLNNVCTKIVKKRVERINTRTTFGRKLVGSWPTLSAVAYTWWYKLFVRCDDAVYIVEQ